MPATIAKVTEPAEATEPAGREDVPLGAKLVVRSVSKVFTGRRRSVAALDDIDLHVSTGELVCLLGASGCGKSTLLSIIGGLETATSGDVRVDGELVVGPGADRGMVFQAYSLYPWLSVARNIAFGLKVLHWPAARRAERVTELLGIMALTECANALPRELSGGMRQRVAIARALAPEPDVLLLDEPFGALDAQTRRHLQDFLLTVWHRTGATILMVTHDVEEAVYLAQRVYVMAGRAGVRERSSAPPEPHARVGEAAGGRVAAEIIVPFGTNRGTAVRRDPRFLDLRDELSDLLVH